MQNYLNLLAEIRYSGAHKQLRAGGARCLFGKQLRFKLSAGFPILTTKKAHFKSVAEELLWFISGSTNVKDLQAKGVKIWDAWAPDDGDLGPIYGKQWRDWSGYDQLLDVVNGIRANPDSTRLIVSAWNVSDISKCALPPCHVMFQFYAENNRLSCMVTQRSADMFIGVPFNIVSYALLTHLVAAQCGMSVGELIWSGAICHIYDDHLNVVDEQLSRYPLPLPTLKIKERASIIDYQFSDFKLINYDHFPPLKATVNV